MNKLYGVSFSKCGKVYFFKNLEKTSCEIGSNVIVETEKGEQFGIIVSIETDEVKISKFKNLKNILRIANSKDNDTYNKNLQDSKNALVKCKEIVKDLKLNMNFVNASYTFDRSQLLFNFYADERIDFRELAKKLASIYKTRIELRQIGARDKAREVCGHGVCGQKLCCSRFLNQMESVSINMAKNQCIALNPNKINGSCNRLLCCLAYEDSIYSDYRTKLPEIGERIVYQGKKGVVKSLDILQMKYVADFNGDRIEIVVNEDSKK